MTLRALYDYVIRAITNTNRNRVQGYLTHRIRQSSIGGIEEVDAQTQPQPLAPVSPPLPLGTIPSTKPPNHPEKNLVEPLQNDSYYYLTIRFLLFRIIIGGE